MSTCVLLIVEGCQRNHIIQRCYPSYSIFKEDQQPYGPEEAHDEFEYYKYYSHAAWQYRSAGQLSGVPVWGKLTTYSGGGFVARLDWNKNVTFAIAQELKEYGWIDRQTRAVFVEFTIYNPNANLFAFVSLLAEFPKTGGVVHYPTIQIMKAYALDMMTVVYAGCGFILIVYLAAFIILFIKGLFVDKCHYFTSIAHWLNICIIICIMTMAITFFMRKISLDKALNKMKADKNTYVQFRKVMTYDDSYKYGIAFLNMFAVLKCIFMLRLNTRIAKLLSTLQLAWKTLKSWLLIFLLIYIAFISWFHLTYMCHFEMYSSFLYTTESLLGISLGDMDIGTLNEVFPILTPIIFIIYSFIVVTILFDILIILIMEAHYLVETKPHFWDSESHLVDVLLDMTLQHTQIMHLGGGSLSK